MRTRGNIRRNNRIGYEGVLTRAESEKAPVGIGFAHKFHRSSDVVIDQDLLATLKTEDQERAPYLVPKPRHVTSIPRLAIDGYAMSFLRLGNDIRELISSLEENCQDMDEPTNKPLECEVGEVIEIGGRRVIAEVDNARVSKIRSGIKSLFQSAGVAIPEMYPPHMVIGHADSFRAQHRISSAASDVISGKLVTVETVSVYTNTYTELERPEYIPPE